MLHEEVQLPRELVAIERDLVGNEFVGRELRALALHSEHELDRLLVEAVVFDWLRDAEVRLQRHVAEIFQNEDAEIVGMAGDRRYRQRKTGEQPPDVDERQLVERERRRRTPRAPPTDCRAEECGKYCRVDASPVRGTTRTCGPDIPARCRHVVDPRARVLKRRRAAIVIHHESRGLPPRSAASAP